MPVKRKSIFKNILCYGSAIKCVPDKLPFIVFKNILCYGSAAFPFAIANDAILFKNILCYGSAQFSQENFYGFQNLKTSYVMVRLFIKTTL